MTAPHILLIVADDLGWNDVSFHGSTQIPTPHIDALAHGGVILDNYYVQPVCSPTRSSLLTGRHVIHSGIYDPDCNYKTTNAVPTQFTMLPKHLRSLGYETFAVGKWHLGYFAPDVLPTGRGFDEYFGYYGGAEDYFTHTAGFDEYIDIHDDNATIIRPAQGLSGHYSTHLYTDRAVSIIQRFAERHQHNDAASSLFLYLAYQAIHSPDEAPESYKWRFNKTIPDTPDGVGQHRRIVAGMVAALDEGIGNVTNALDASGMAQRTLIVFTTDNGGPAQGFNSNMASNWPLRGMKRTLWEGGVRGSGFVYGAGIRKAGVVSHALLHVTDLPISLLALATNGVEVDPLSPAWADWREHPKLRTSMRGEPPFDLGDGVDNWAAISTGAPSARTEVLHEAHKDGSNKEDGNGQALRIGDFKLIYEKGPQWHGPPNDLWYTSGSNPSQYDHTVHCPPPPLPNASDYCHPHKLPCLFNVAEDPCEMHDLSTAMPLKLAQMVERLKAYQATAVLKGFHTLTGVNCTASSPAKHPEWLGFWMPFCAATAPGPGVMGTRIAEAPL